MSVYKQIWVLMLAKKEQRKIEIKMNNVLNSSRIEPEWHLQTDYESQLSDPKNLKLQQLFIGEIMELVKEKNLISFSDNEKATISCKLVGSLRKI